MGKLDGKVALITGSGSGMGRATARLFGKEGAKVAVVDWVEPNARKVAADMREDGGDAIAITADVSKAADTERMVKETTARWGRLDIIYNNAGIGPVNLVHTMPEEEWDRVLSVNLKGVFLGCKYALPELMKHGGVVLSTASISGMEGTNGLPHYCASKAGIIALTKVIAMDYAEFGIRANCICPGGINTALNETYRPKDPEGLRHWWNATNNVHLLGRQGEPEEIARAALFLCSDDSSFITGHAIPVDGGFTVGHRMMLRPGYGGEPTRSK
jgi:meso-butanediol dehydrogenase / (S,S)-butanediol dehydrogenase / diacetyl reductase